MTTAPTAAPNSRAEAPAVSSAVEARVPAVRVSDLSLAYGEARILNQVSFDLRRGEVLALLGPSGCGKTTLLRLVAGLLSPTGGRIEIDGKPVANFETGLERPPEARGLGMVFQDYALWPHMSVAANVSFPLEMRGVDRADRSRRVDAALARVGLGAMAARRPSDLSGGQQQRVAIARAIVAEPQLVLFDEPLSNLDRELRESMVSELGTLVSSLGLTAIYVTHDQAEAFALADRIAVMRGGRIEQLAPPEVLVNAPASAEVAEFLRLGPVLPAVRKASGWVVSGTDMHFAFSAAHPAAQAQVLLPSRAITIGAPVLGRLTGTVISTQFQGQGHATVLRLSGTQHEIRLTSPTRLSPGEKVGLSVTSEDLRWFPRAAA